MRLAIIIELSLWCVALITLGLIIFKKNENTYFIRKLTTFCIIKFTNRIVRRVSDHRKLKTRYY